MYGVTSLTSLDDPEVQLVAASPELVSPGYEVSLDEADAALLGAGEADDLIAFVVCTVGDAAAGCVAVRPWRAGACEMKRLYVPPAGQGKGVGEALSLAVMDHARALGYTLMRLDTAPELALPLTAQSTEAVAEPNAGGHWRHANGTAAAGELRGLPGRAGV